MQVYNTTTTGEGFRYLQATNRAPFYKLCVASPSSSEEVDQVVQKLAPYMFYLDPEDIKSVDARVFAKCIAAIDSVPLHGELTVLYLCLKRVNGVFSKLFSEEYDPPLAHSIRWDQLPKRILEEYSKDFSQILQSPLSGPSSSRASELIYLEKDKIIVWHPQGSNKTSFTLRMEKGTEGVFADVPFEVKTYTEMGNFVVKFQLQENSPAPYAFTNLVPTFFINGKEAANDENIYSRNGMLTQSSACYGRLSLDQVGNKPTMIEVCLGGNLQYCHLYTGVTPMTGGLSVTSILG